MWDIQIQFISPFKLINFDLDHMFSWFPPLAESPLLIGWIFTSFYVWTFGDMGVVPIHPNHLDPWLWSIFNMKIAPILLFNSIFGDTQIGYRWWCIWMYPIKISELMSHEIHWTIQPWQSWGFISYVISCHSSIFFPSWISRTVPAARLRLLRLRLLLLPWGVVKGGRTPGSENSWWWNLNMCIY